jgi:tetraacyldisaccharide 4'-kinase
MPGYLKIISIILFPLILIYTGIIYLRNRLYDLGIFETCDSPLPTISVGNIQVGGTGKTPLVEYLAGKLLEENYHPAIITRGYARQEKHAILADPSDKRSISVEQVGDEPFLLMKNLPGIPIAVNADRCAAASLLKKKYPGSIIILDDGFQHRRISRHFDIVLIDVSRWPNGSLLFPFTFLRDVKSSLKRAQVLILTRTGLEPVKSNSIKESMERKFKIPVFTAEIIPHQVISLRETAERFPVTHLQDKKVAAFCGIGNPWSFFTNIEHTGARLCWKKIFPDHHLYTAGDIEIIRHAAEKSGAQAVITTQKDSVKLDLKDIRSSAIEFYFLKISMRIKEEDRFLKMLEDALEYDIA